MLLLQLAILLLCLWSTDSLKYELCFHMLVILQALDVLLDLSASSHEQSRSGRHVKDSVNYKEDARFLAERSDNVSVTICVVYSVGNAGYPHFL